MTHAYPHTFREMASSWQLYDKPKPHPYAIDYVPLHLVICGCPVVCRLMLALVFTTDRTAGPDRLSVARPF